MVQVALIMQVIAGTAVDVGLAKKCLSEQKAKLYVVLMFTVYLLGNKHFTLLSHVVESGAMMDLRLLRSYLRMRAGSIEGYENVIGFAALFPSNMLPIVGQILNVLFYCPMGYLLPVLKPKHSIWQVILIGFLHLLRRR